MSSWQHQSLIEAPIRDVWELVGDPKRYPEWAQDVVSVTGVPDEIHKGTRFERESRLPLGSRTTEFVVDELADLQEIRMRCLTSGYYSRWALTEAGQDTFCEVEVGMEPTSAPYKLMDRAIGKRWYRSAVSSMVDGLRKTLA
jgi:polyketide cyclase/dehydrase/lipid transport protein